MDVKCKTVGKLTATSQCWDWKLGGSPVGSSSGFGGMAVRLVVAERLVIGVVIQKAMTAGTWILSSEMKFEY